MKNNQKINLFTVDFYLLTICYLSKFCKFNNFYLLCIVIIKRTSFVSVLPKYHQTKNEEERESNLSVS